MGPDASIVIIINGRVAAAADEANATATFPDAASQPASQPAGQSQFAYYQLLLLLLSFTVNVRHVIYRVHVTIRRSIVRKKKKRNR